MCRFSAGCSRNLRQQKGDDKTSNVHKRHRETAPLNSPRVNLRFRVDRSKHMTRDGGKIKKHKKEQAEPCTNLHRCKLSHSRRHFAKTGKDLVEPGRDPSFRFS